MAGKKRYWVVGTDGCAQAFEGNNLAKLDAEARRRGLRHWAVYDQLKPGFHNASDRAYLVYHVNDPFWLNSGVPSKKV
jgi:hypothetical protein